MTYAEVVRSFRARRVGKGKSMAKCPNHREKTASVSVTDMGQGNTRVHCFAGCAQADVLKAAGLTWRDLRPGDVAPAIRLRLSDESYLEALEKRLGLMDMMRVLDREQPHYWWKAIDNVEQEVIQLRRKLYPEDRLPIRLRGVRKGRRLA